MISHETAVGAKTARACDYCVRKRARWYCAADDAFLCQSCDGSVHSANPLARRHERVRLKSASDDRSCIPTWHRGLTRKARTPRHGKSQPKIDTHCTSSTTTTTTNHSNDWENEEVDHQMELLYRVPILDPFDLDMDFDMAEFAADVESLLGKGLDGEIEELGLVKAEEELVPTMEGVMEEVMEPFELSFNYNSPVSYGEIVAREADEEKREWRMSLRLDYEAISAAWASHGSPWVNGERPEISPSDCWLHGTMGGIGEVRPIGEVVASAGQGASGDGGREARVSRYREKRRTRLFSKKIRYEVRKLNAEKRPRMKGRFVKRSSFNTTPTAGFPLLGK